MGFNAYKEFEKIKKSLVEKGYSKEVPIEEFGKEIMLDLGCSRKRAIQWIRNFEIVGFINDKGDKVIILK